MTLWVSTQDWLSYNRQENRLLAYDLATGARVSALDFGTFRTPAKGPSGLWSDGTIVWFAGDWAGRLFAYELATGDRRPDMDFNNLHGAENRYPAAPWSDGTTMWVADERSDKVFAYDMAP